MTRRGRPAVRVLVLIRLLEAQQGCWRGPWQNKMSVRQTRSSIASYAGTTATPVQGSKRRRRLPSEGRTAALPLVPQAAAGHASKRHPSTWDVVRAAVKGPLPVLSAHAPCQCPHVRSTRHRLLQTRVVAALLKPSNWHCGTSALFDRARRPCMFRAGQWGPRTPTARLICFGLPRCLQGVVAQQRKSGLVCTALTSPAGGAKRSTPTNTTRKQATHASCSWGRQNTSTAVSADRSRVAVRVRVVDAAALAARGGVRAQLAKGGEQRPQTSASAAREQSLAPRLCICSR